MRGDIPSEWGDRYGKRVDEWRLPEKEKDREIYIQMVGQDGAALLDDVWFEEAPGWMRSLPAVETLRRMWLQHFMVAEGAALLRPSEDLPPSSLRITSPYDTQARFAYKRSAKWVGYVEWDREKVICPAGRESSSWKPMIDGRGNDFIQVAFARSDCSVCVHISQCTSAKGRRRTANIKPKEFHESLQQNRQREKAKEFKEEYS